MRRTLTGLSEFIKLCYLTEDEKKLATLFELFLTNEERESISLRYLIVKELLLQEKTQREIAKKLNVSIAKITRGSNELKRLDKKTLTYLHQKLS